MNSKIDSIQLTPVFVPFKKIISQAMDSGEGGKGMAIPTDEPWHGGDGLICQITNKDGNVGLGEVLVWQPDSNVSKEQVIDAIQNSLHKYVLGESPFNIEHIRQRMEDNNSKNEIAKGLLDIACYDLMGQITGRPAHDFMGGKCINEVPLTALLHLADVKMMTLLAKAYYRSGYRSIRIKLGKTIAEDTEIIRSIREKVGPSVRLRVDYNQAYRPAEAVRAIKAIEPFGIELAEQPINKNDYLGLVYLQKHVDMPIMTHEGSFSMTDYLSLIEMGAQEVLGINTEHPGGITNALRMINYAEQRGLGIVMHAQPFGIGSAVHLHLAAAKYNSLGHSPEIFDMFEDDLITHPINFLKGKATIPEGPGWGVKLDEKALQKYATGPTVVIEN